MLLGVDDLVPERADGHVRPLRHIEDVCCQATLRAARLAHDAVCQRPQASQHPA